MEKSYFIFTTFGQVVKPDPPKKHTYNHHTGKVYFLYTYSNNLQKMNKTSCPILRLTSTVRNTIALHHPLSL